MTELRRADPDGVIMNESHLDEEVIRNGIPLIAVVVNKVTPGISNLATANHEAAVMAADHLMGQGLREFAFAGYDGAIWSIERRNGFCERLAERGFSARVHLVPLSPTMSQRTRCETEIGRWLKSLPKPVGIMACNDDFARITCEECRIHGLKVPDEIALIGADNDELICQLSSPPLSSISFSTERAGYDAAALLDALMSGKKRKPENIVVSAACCEVRQSTDLLAVEDEEVAKALRFIRENSHRLIQATEAANATLLSHRTLHNRFCRAVGHSIGKEINLRRIEHISRFLRTTNESIEHIARSIGYENQGHMARFFHRETGMTPRAYRNMSKL